MRTIFLLRGTPASGKSTWVEQNKLQQYTLSADNIRLMYQSPVLNNNGDSISRYNVMLELENINLIKELVSQNYGVSILPRSVCQQEIKKGKLIEVELEDFHIHRGIYIVYKNKCAYLNICQEIENVIASKKGL